MPGNQEIRFYRICSGRVKLGGLGGYKITLVHLGPVSVTQASNQIHRLMILLTRWWNAALKPAVPELAKFDLVLRG